jgi:dipeptidase E
MPILRQIVALGGGGFSMEPRNPRLDDYILRLTQKPRPKVCFIPTASGDSLRYINQFERAFASKAETSHLALFRRTVTDLKAFLLALDIIYVGGGNVANLLAVWRLHGVDRILRLAWQNGVILCGVSAGMNCWFEGCVTDSFGPLAPLRDGLGLLPGSARPHYDGEKERRPAYHRFIASGLPGGLAAEDGAAIHFVSRNILRCVSSRPNAKAYRVQLTKGAIAETPLPTLFLGKKP